MSWAGKKELWDRWRAGESISDIARRLQKPMVGSAHKRNLSKLRYAVLPIYAEACATVSCGTLTQTHEEALILTTRVRLSVDVEPEIRRRVKVAAAGRDQSVREWIEGAIRHELERTDEDLAWLGSDLSKLGEMEPYEWGEGEIEEGLPVRREPGMGAVVEGGKKRVGR